MINSDALTTYPIIAGPLERWLTVGAGASTRGLPALFLTEQAGLGGVVCIAPPRNRATPPATTRVTILGGRPTC